MRPAQKSNRSRGRGNRKGGGGGGGNNINRVYDSAGPEGKVRGTPQQIIDKYVSLARDAQTSGDRVAAENFLQHAEHYQRLLITAMGAQEQARRDQAQQPDQNQEGQPDQAATPSESKDQDQAAPTGSEIGGMTTIDADGESPSLLVEAEEVTASQPKRNGTNRRRSKADKSEGAEQASSETDADAAAPATKTADAEAEGVQAET